MADDQETLASFADESDTDPDEEEGDTAGGGVSNRSTDDGDGTEEGGTGGEGGVDEAEVVPSGGDDRVCPWCLAAADRFVEMGPTGLACGRCSAALPVGAEWFDAREVVARRPMYEADD